MEILLEGTRPMLAIACVCALFVLLAMMIDLMIHYSHLLLLMRLHPIVGFPVVTCLMSIFLCVIEFMSIRERAEDKERKNMNRAIQILAEAIGKDNLQAILRDKVDNTINNR